ncbi:NAD(P)-binding protein [Rhizodiscina lignyota]|uniref:NAD(P)-binding protein n=1 Tax=Rhizodiscina lignyota TaxID=1504668 RepID=A0A9P4M3A3_9PEZI|nr:NAD(P)-binding protein [Rhizodiscina lignyota]
MAEGFTSQFHYSTYPSVSPTRPELSLKGKSVLVTGGGYGIGPAIVESFAQAGASKIALSGRTESKLKGTAENFGRKYRSTEFHPFVADVTDAKAVKEIFDTFGVPDVLVNNAGYMAEIKPIVEFDNLRDDWWKAFEPNILVTATVTQAYLLARKAAGTTSPGTVLTISTLGVHWGTQLIGVSNYSASKAGQLRMMELFAAEVGDEVRFVTVHPGAVDTAMSMKSGLKGKLVETDLDMVGNWMVWATANADWMDGRFFWLGWDVDELLKKKDEILEKNLLTYTIVGL